MINLLPYQEKKIVERMRVLRVINVTVFIAILLVIAAALLLLPTLVTINSRYELAQQQVSLLEKEGVVANPVDVQNLENRTKELVAKLAVPEEVSPTEYVEIITSTANASIMLTTFSFAHSEEAPTLSVAGVATSREALQSYVSKLQSHESIASVDSPITNYVKNKDADFRITVVFKK